MAIISETVTMRQMYPTHPSIVRFQDTREKRVQKPFVDPEIVLPYTRTIVGVFNQQHYGASLDTPWDAFSTAANARLSFHRTSTEDAKALSRAYSRMLEDLKLAQAGMGETLAEGREAISMIVQRAKQLGKAYSELRRGRFRSFLNTLQARPLDRHRKTRWTRPRDASALWLEYWLGWSPTVQTMYDAAEVITSDFNRFHDGPLRISGRGSAKFSHVTPMGSGLNRGSSTVTGKVRYQLGCKVEIENPNLLLLNQMGLANPVSVAWALVPLSFVAGWFMNLQQVLNSYTDFVGMNVTRPYTSRSCLCESVEKREYWWYGNQLLRASSIEGHAYEFSRTTSLTLPKLYFWVPAGLSPSRGATAISLLVSLFTKG